MTDTAKLAEQHLSNWKNQEESAEHLLALVAKLYREKNIITSVYGRSLVNQPVVDILKAHRRTRLVADELSVSQTLPVVEALLNRDDVGASNIDIAKVAISADKNGSDINAALDKLFADVSWQSGSSNTTDVVLYGFGRIGRLMARIIIDQTGSDNGLRLKGIVVRKGQEGDVFKRASLLRRDSVHGSFNGSIVIDEENNAIIANGNFIQIIYSNGPDQVDYTQYGINDALVIDNTGIWKDEDGLGLHLKSKGVKKVILTAPSKGDIKNIVYGVNNNEIADDDNIISAASCTTNAITPTLKVLNDKYGIENGHLETIHAFTNDQNLIDNYHKSDRRGRSAALNMVITSTGAAKAVAKALPALKGKLSGNAIRVPTPNVSLAILNLNLANPPKDADELNAFMRDIAVHSNLQAQIDYTESSEIVSSDCVGSKTAGIFDSQATKVHDNTAIVYLWYDNEYGYSWQVFRIAQQMANINYVQLPEFDVQA